MLFLKSNSKRGGGAKWISGKRMNINNGVKRWDVTAFVRTCWTKTVTMKGSNKGKSFVEPMGLNSSNFKNETLFVSFTAIRNGWDGTNVFIGNSMVNSIQLCSLALLYISLLQLYFSFFLYNIQYNIHMIYDIWPIWPIWPIWHMTWYMIYDILLSEFISHPLFHSPVFCFSLVLIWFYSCRFPFCFLFFLSIVILLFSNSTFPKHYLKNSLFSIF